MKPYSATFNEHYWSGGTAEKSYVFLGGNGLPQRFVGKDSFTVAELGFGTGLNCLLTAAAWQTANPHGQLTFISYELEPFPLSQLQVIHSIFPPELSSLSIQLLAHWPPQPGWNTFSLGSAALHLFIGDANTGILSQPQPVDAWFLDGFSPARNPQLWQPELLSRVAALTRPGGTFATYSAVGEVRRNLQAVGFTVTRQAGFPPKRHMLTGIKGE